MNHSTTRTARNIGTTVVAGIAGYASYWHQVAVARIAGEREELAHIMPFSVDGLLIVASVAMVDARGEGRKPSWRTKVAFATAIAASVGANVMSAQPTLLGRVVAAWPALALLLTVETLSSRGRRVHEVPRPPAAPTSPGYPPEALYDDEAALKFREAQQELRKTSRLAGMR